MEVLNALGSIEQQAKKRREKQRRVRMIGEWV